MSFTWPWPKLWRQPYSTLQQEEIDDVALEKERAPEKKFSPQPRIFHVLFLLVNTALLWVAVQIYLQGSLRASAYHHGLVRSPIPEFPREVKTFDSHPIFMDRPSEESDAAWELLGGPPRDHRGFIFLENSEAYGLGSEKSDNGKNMYGVSMLHQLHCLGNIRKMFWGILQGRLNAQELLDGYPKNTTDPTFEATTHGLWHISHCFDYVRQGIQCAGDMSLEWPVQINGENLVVGWNNPHECKSWDAAWRYIETHS